VLGLGVRPSERCLPSSNGESHTPSRLPCQRSFLREVAGAGVCVPRPQVGRRTGAACEWERSFFQRCRERMRLRARLSRGMIIAHFEKRLCLPARRSRPVLPFDRRGPECGTIEQTKTGRPTQVAQADGWRSFRRLWPLAVFASRGGGGLSSAARLAPKR
jgi:hypothetical protein